MAAPATFIPDKAPKSFVPDAPSTFVADSPAEEMEFDLSRRQMPDLQATTRGGPALALPDAKVAGAAFDEEILGGIRDVITHEGIEIPKLGITPETAQRALNAAGRASDYEISGEIPTLQEDAPIVPGTAAKVISGGLEGLEELTHGVVNFFTSGPGVLQLGVAATPLAPAVYAKWALDMAEAGIGSAEEAWDAFQKSDWRDASKNTVMAFGSFLGARAAAKHGVKELRTPEADAFNTRTEEANRKALEATMPPRIVTVLKQNNAPVTGAVVEQMVKESPKAAETAPLNPGGALKDLPPELQAKSNAVQDAMRAEFEELKRREAEQQTKPIKVYHGGPPNALESNWPKWFTTLKGEAEAYGKGSVFEAEVAPKNPLISRTTLPIEAVEKAFESGHDAIIIGTKENPIHVIVPGTKTGAIDQSKFSIQPKQSPATPIAASPEPKTAAVVEQAAASNLPEQPGLKESEIVGMGAAIPEEFKPSQQLPTANKNASIDADRVARGEAPLMSAMRKSDPELWDQAMSVVENDWQAADKLIARHKAEPFVPTDTDLMVLLHRRTDLKNTFAKLSREYAQAAEDGRAEVSEAARQSRDMVLDQLRELEAIIGRGDTAMGTMTGRALRARRLAMNEDYSLASLIVDREARLKRKLTPEETAELEKISQEQAAVSESLGKVEAEREAQKQEIEARSIAERAAKDQEFSPYVLKLAEDIVKSWDARADRARARLREKWGRTSTGLDPTILVDLSEIGVSHLAHAGLDFAKWTARMVDDLGEFAERAKPYFEKAFERSKKLAEDEKAKRAGPKKAEVDKAIARVPTTETIDGIVTRLAKRFEKNPQLDFSMPAKKLARYFYEQGITKPMELIDAVHAKLVEAMPELTKRETMDALSGYGRFTPLKKDAVSVGLRDAYGQMQQIAKLEDMAAGQAPLKTGQERRVPTDEERRLIKQVEEKKKEGGYDVTDPEAQLRTALQAYERRLNNQINDLAHEIETRTKIVKNKRKLELDPKLKSLRDKRDFFREVHREVFAPAPLTEAQRLAKWKELTQEKIDDYKIRLMERDFAPRKRPDPPRLDAEAIKLRYELHKVHNALMDMRLRDQLKQRTQLRKIYDGAGNVIRFSRALMTGGEFSAVFRQGGFTFLSHPALSTRAMKSMFQALMSEKEQFRINEEIQTRPNAPLYQRNKLQFTESGVRLSTMEEHYMFRISEKIGKNPLAKYPIKFVNAFQRAYTTYLNRIRADAFDALLDTYGDSPVMQKQIAELINVATGRGSSSVGRFVGPGANTLFFAPRYTISRFQLLLGQPAWSGNKATRKMVIQEYGRALAGAAVVYSLGMMAGGTIEDDPRSSDFGKVKLGNTRIDPLFGLAQVSALLSKEATGYRKTGKGKLIPIREANLAFPFKDEVELPFGQPNAWDVIASFGRSKLSPAVGSGVSLLVGKDPVGQKFQLSDALIQSATPITYGDILKAMEEQGVERGLAIATLAMFGMGVQTYDVNEKRKD